MHLTPSQLSAQPNIKSIVVPDYDFGAQSRRILMAGLYTSNSVQTFDFYGKPRDAQNDNND